MACTGALPRRRSSTLLAASTVGVERLSVLFSAAFLFPVEELGRGVMILPAAGMDMNRRLLTRQEHENYRLRGKNTNERENNKKNAAGSAALLQVEAAEGRNLLQIVSKKRSDTGFLEQQSTRVKDSDTVTTSGRGRGGGRNGGNGNGGTWRDVKDANGGAGKGSGSKGEGGSKGGGRDDNGAAGEGAGQGGPSGQQGQEAQHQQGTAQGHSATVVSHADATEATAAGGVATQEAQSEEVLIKQTTGGVGHHGGHQTGAGQAGHSGKIVAHQERQIVGEKKTSSSPPAEPAPPLDDPEDIACARKAGSEQECEGADPAAQRCFFRPAFSDPTGRTDENGVPYVYPAECVGGKNGCDAVSDQQSCDQLPVCAWVDSTDEVLLGARVAGFASLQPEVLDELTPQTSPFQALDTSGGLRKERLPDVDREDRPHAEQWCTALKHLGTCAMFSANAEQCVRHGCPGAPMYRLDAPASSCTGTLGENLVPGAPPSLGPCCFRFAFGTGVEPALAERNQSGGDSAAALKIVSCSAGEDPEAPDGEFGPVHEQADICPRDVAEAQDWVVSGAEGSESSSNAPATTTSGGQTSGTSGTNGPASSSSTGMSNSNGGILFSSGQQVTNECEGKTSSREDCEAVVDSTGGALCWFQAEGDANSPWAVCHEWSEDTERAGCAAKTAGGDGVCDALNSCTMQDFSADASSAFDKEILTDLGQALLTELESVGLNQLEADGLAVAKACVPASKLETCESFSGNAMACVRKGCEKFPTKEDPTCTGAWGANLYRTEISRLASSTCF